MVASDILTSAIKRFRESTSRLLLMLTIFATMVLMLRESSQPVLTTALELLVWDTMRALSMLRFWVTMDRVLLAGSSTAYSGQPAAIQILAGRVAPKSSI